MTVLGTALLSRPEESGNGGRLAVLAWVLAPIAPLAAFLVGNGALPVAAVALAFAAIASLGARWGARSGGILVALGLIGQAIAFTAALAGHPWQIDSHMLFFALLAMLMVLADPLVILVAAAAIAVHHLSLGIFLPSLIYPAGDVLANLQRTALHGGIVILEAAVLAWAITARNRSDAASTEARAAAEASSRAAAEATGEAERARADAEKALEDAREAHGAAERARLHAEAETERAREADRQARRREEDDRQKRDALKQTQDQVVQRLRDALAALATGNLAAPIAEPFAPDYEDLRNDFNGSLAALNEALTRVRGAADAMDEETSGIAGASGALASRAETQAASLAQLSATASSLLTQVEQTASKADEARHGADRTRHRAEESGALVGEAVETMERIAESSKQIQSIVSVIDEIAFQTNLLALNAGVEAARAGDAGRGFAVVASEVRALAQRSSDAAHEIRALIDASGTNVAQGVQVVNGTGTALEQVSRSVNEIAAQISSIADTAKVQAESLSEINGALRDLDAVNQKNAAVLEETSAACQSLKRQGAGLIGALGAFRMEESAPRPSTDVAA